MALQDIMVKDSTDRSVTVAIVDSGDGTPETGVVWNTAGIDLWYRREGAVRTAVTEATLAALTTAHTDGGFLHVSDGVYRLDLPDAAFATGAEYVDFGGTVTGMVVIGGRTRLVDFDVETAAVSAASLVDNIWDEDLVAAHGTSDTSGLLVRALGALISQRTNNPTLNALLGVADSAGADVPSAATDDVWDEATSSHVAAGSFGLAAPFSTQIADSVPADGTIPTREQALYMINQFLMERAVSGTTVTVKKADGSTALMTLTLDDSNDPNSITRAS